MRQYPLAAKPTSPVIHEVTRKARSVSKVLEQGMVYPIHSNNAEEDETVLITTTPSVEGKRIEAYLGVVAGEAILGANVFRDIFAGLRDIVGGRSSAYERELENARVLAFEDMEAKARALGANAIVGVDIDYEVVGAGGSMLMVSASGTAVRLSS